MTAICGYQSNGTAWIGADSAAASNNHRGPSETSKLVELKLQSPAGERNLILGYTTSFRFGQILAHHLVLPWDIGEQPDRYLVKEVVPKIREVLSEHGWLSKQNEREEGGTALIAYSGRIYEFQDDNSVLHWSDPFAACGSGYQYALGAMSSTGRESGDGIVKAGLEAAARFAPGVMAPFKVLKVSA